MARNIRWLVIFRTQRYKGLIQARTIRRSNGKRYNHPRGHYASSKVRVREEFAMQHLRTRYSSRRFAARSLRAATTRSGKRAGRPSGAPKVVLISTDDKNKVPLSRNCYPFAVPCGYLLTEELEFFQNEDHDVPCAARMSVIPSGTAFERSAKC